MKKEVNLWSKGYSAEVWLTGVWRVWRPHKQGYYLVDAELRKCQCMGFGRTGHCKHLQGLRQLLLEQAISYGTVRRELCAEEKERKDRDVLAMLETVGSLPITLIRKTNDGYDTLSSV